MRTIIKPQVEVIEDIAQVIDHTDHIEFYVGVKELVDGNYVYKIPQQFEQYTITNVLLQQFKEDHPISYVKADLWPYVDMLRVNANTPPQATYYHWDGATQVWVADLPKAKQHFCNKVNVWRKEQEESPILYGEILVDADAKARENIKGKLLQLQIEEELEIASSNFVWRDANDVTHTWETLAAYKTWLKGLALAVTNRATNLYIQGWTKKAAIAALASISEVEAYDVEG